MNSYSDDIQVSVVVITYNSSSTVLETLNSVAEQTYNNIELIITDDCSHDNTVAVCQSWIDSNHKRFERVKLLTTDNNTGTSGNLNRGIKECKGKWIKSIAGDDRLLPNCIIDNVNYITTHPNVDLLFSKVRFFGEMRLIEGRQIFKYHYFELDENEFYIRLLKENFLPAASVFINSRIFDRIGYFDESIPLLEDWPYWMKAGFNKCIFKFMDIETVEYRVQENVSLSSTPSKRYLECEKKAIKLSLSYMKAKSKVLWIKWVVFLYTYKFYRSIKSLFYRHF